MSSTYKDFIKDSLNHYSMAIMMCEIFYIYFRLYSKIDVSFIEKYIEIRNKIAPSPALIGFDLTCYNNSSFLKKNQYKNLNFKNQYLDFLFLNEDKILIVNCSESDLVIGDKNLIGKFSLNYVKIGKVNDNPQSDTINPLSAAILAFE